MVASKGGISLQQAREMSILDKHAYYLALCEIHGGKVDYDTAEVEWPEPEDTAQKGEN